MNPGFKLTSKYVCVAICCSDSFSSVRTAFFTHACTTTYELSLVSYGIDAEEQSLAMPKSVLHGDASYIADSATSEAADTFQVKIQSFPKALAEAGGAVPTLFHVNCEGCEWSMMLNLLKRGQLKDVKVIQFATHNYGEVGVGRRALELCEIRQLLNVTHEAVFSQAFAWERWVARN